VQAILGDRSITDALYRVKRFNEYDEPSSSSVEVMRTLQRDADADRGWFQRHFNPTAMMESLEEASQPNVVERLVTEHPLIALIPVESMFKSVQTAGAVALRSATSAAKAIPYVGAVVMGVEVANEVCKGLTGEGLYENLINYAKGGKDAVGKSKSSGLGSGPGRGRVQSTPQDADRYLAGLQKQKGLLSKKKISLDEREYYEFMEKTTYNGVKFKKGDLISRDTLHHEWEWFRGKNTHKGAISSTTGKVDVSKIDDSRVLRIK
jgi:hypothetical protein